MTRVKVSPPKQGSGIDQGQPPPPPRLVRIVVGVGVFPLNRIDRLNILLIQGAKMVATIKEHHVKFRPLWHFEIE